MRYCSLSILSVLIFLSGCSASGPKYFDHLSRLPAVKENSARVVVFRPADSVRFSTRAASLALDDSTLGKCEYGGFNIFDVPANSHTLSVDIWDFPGSCLLSVEWSSGKEYYYEIQPRSLAWFVIPFYMGAIAMSGGWEEMLFGGSAFSVAESTIRECGGVFTVAPVTADLAKTKLSDLRLSEQSAN